MNDLTNAAAGVPAHLASVLQNLHAGLNNVTTHIETPIQPGGMPLLGLDREGRWNYGQTNTYVSPQSLIAFDLSSLKHGWVAWKDSKPHLQMVPASAPKPHPHTLPNHGVEWQECLEIGARFAQGPDAGVEVIYRPSSLGGIRAIANLLEAVKKQFLLDPTMLTPIVHLSTTNYANKKYGGTTYVPVLNLVGWDATELTTGGKSAPAPQAAPPPPPPPTAPPVWNGAQTAQASPQAAEQVAEAPKPKRTRAKAADAAPAAAQAAEQQTQAAPVYQGTMAQRVAEDTAHHANQAPPNNAGDVDPPFAGAQPARRRRTLA